MRRKILFALAIVGAGMVWWDFLLIPGQSTWLRDVGDLVTIFALSSLLTEAERQLAQVKAALEDTQYKVDFWKTIAKEKS